MHLAGCESSVGNLAAPFSPNGSGTAEDHGATNIDAPGLSGDIVLSMETFLVSSLVSKHALRGAVPSSNEGEICGDDSGNASKDCASAIHCGCRKVADGTSVVEPPSSVKIN